MAMHRRICPAMHSDRAVQVEPWIMLQGQIALMRPELPFTQPWRQVSEKSEPMVQVVLKVHTWAFNTPRASSQACAISFERHDRSDLMCSGRHAAMLSIIPHPGHYDMPGISDMGWWVMQAAQEGAAQGGLCPPLGSSGTAVLEERPGWRSEASQHQHAHIRSCRVMSCHVMLCRVLSCHVMSFHVVSFHVMSCHPNKHARPPDALSTCP